MSTSSRRQTTVEDLPDECLALIFPFLKSKRDRDAAALSCRRWRSLDALSRHSLHVRWNGTLPEEDWHHGLLKALHIFPHIVSIIVEAGESKRLAPSFFTLFPTGALTQLQALDLNLSYRDRSRINDEFLECLAHSCPALTHLKVSESDITDAGLSFLAHGCRRLELLDVSFGKVTDTGIDVVLAMCPNMGDIYVTENPDIQGWGFRHGKQLRYVEAACCHISEAGLTEGLQGATSLLTLNLDSMEGSPMLASIGTCCKLLRSLYLTWSSLDDISLEVIAQGCSNLELLDAGHSNDVTLHGWQALARLSVKLVYLDVQGCNQFCEDSLTAIYNGCPNLLYLKIPDRFLPPYPALQRFKVSRPAVRVQVYDDNSDLIWP